MSLDDIRNRFVFHPATTPERQQAHEKVRTEFLITASFLNDIVPDSREKSLMLTHLENAMFWGNAAIARQGE